MEGTTSKVNIFNEKCSFQLKCYHKYQLRIDNLCFSFLHRVLIKMPCSRQRAQSVPISRAKVHPENENTDLKSFEIRSRGCVRCPTCSGKPIIAKPVCIL